MFGEYSNSLTTCSNVGSSAIATPAAAALAAVDVTGPPSPSHSCSTCTGRMPTHAALLIDRKLLAAVAFAFALAHGCATADAGAISANAATAPAEAAAALNLCFIYIPLM